jgi:hypothetical protein
MSKAQAALLLAMAIAVAYLPSAGASFQFDDWNVIVNDARVHSIAAWWHSMPGIRPFTKFTFALNYSLGGAVAEFRILNIVIHGVAAYLVFLLVHKLALRMQWSTGAARWGALWVALVFALHPVQTEAVTYISARSSSLAALCALASIVIWFSGQNQAVPSVPRRACSLLLFALATLAKETAVVLPAALCMIADTKAERRATWPHWLLTTIVIAVVLAWPPYSRLIRTSLEIRPIADNLLTEANALGYLLGQLLRVDGLNADPQLPILSATTPFALLRACAVGAGIAGSLLLLRYRRAWAVGLLWTVIWLAPTNSLLARFEVVNDRQWYLALVGVAWLLACAGRSILRAASAMQRGAAFAGAAAITVALLVATIARNRVYATEITYWSDVQMKSPGNARAANNLGYALMLACRDDEASLQFQRAAALDPKSVKARINLRLLRDGAFRRAPCG